MDHDLEVPVTYKNQELIFPAKFIQFGYSYKFEIDLNGITVFFERDEERNFRAITDHFIEHRDDAVNKELLELVAESLTAMLK